MFVFCFISLIIPTAKELFEFNAVENSLNKSFKNSYKIPIPPIIGLNQPVKVFPIC